MNQKEAIDWAKQHAIHMKDHEIKGLLAWQMGISRVQDKDNLDLYEFSDKDDEILEETLKLVKE